MFMYCRRYDIGVSMHTVFHYERRTDGWREAWSLPSYSKGSCHDHRLNRTLANQKVYQYADKGKERITMLLVMDAIQTTEEVNSDDCAQNPTPSVTHCDRSQPLLDLLFLFAIMDNRPWFLVRKWNADVDDERRR